MIRLANMNFRVQTGATQYNRFQLQFEVGFR